MDEREKMGVRFRLGEGALRGTGWDRRLGDVDRSYALRPGQGRSGRGEPFPPARSTSAVLLGFASSSAARKKSTSFSG